jgi:hypothetical protein
MDKEGLLEREASAWATLEAAVARVPKDRLQEEGVVPGWSVQDLVWHCGRWAGWTVELFARIVDGTYDPAWDDSVPWEQMNSDWAIDSKAMTWSEVHDGAEAARRSARGALASLAEPSEEAMKEFAQETFEHYEEHTAEIARFLESLG